MKVVTSFICPPIPVRTHDWMAYFVGDEEGPTGYGETEADALRDLAETAAELWALHAKREGQALPDGAEGDGSDSKDASAGWFRKECAA